jgi:hypothetical protein
MRSGHSPASGVVEVSVRAKGRIANEAGTRRTRRKKKTGQLKGRFVASEIVALLESIWFLEETVSVLIFSPSGLQN